MDTDKLAFRFAAKDYVRERRALMARKKLLDRLLSESRNRQRALYRTGMSLGYQYSTVRKIVAGVEPWN